MAATDRTFAEASKQIQENLQRHLDRVPSEDQTDRSSSDDEGGQDPTDLMDRVFGHYSFQKSGFSSNTNLPSRTKEAVLDELSAPCLICISKPKRNDPVWTCSACCCSFHLNCIQKWAKDSIFQQQQQNENLEADEAEWACPKCRKAYARTEVPKKYTCYCGKVTDPVFDPWILPHSCGEICGKPLKPQCGHKCLILCHPGPCPPCPKMVKQDCHCRNSAPAARRCHEKFWSCGKPCGKMLNCGQHPCPQPCHGDACRPCSKTSVQLCRCQRHQKKCECAEPLWRCEDKCGKPLQCGHHLCDVVCHDAGDCPPCPLSLIRTCPCGKTSHQLACTTATPTCGNTCGKVLSCEVHRCVERCHRGTCGSCLQMTSRSCRCGSRRRDVPCAKKDFSCDVKCKKVKDCGKHACNKKCCQASTCSGTCDLPCHKMLSCRNHKCSSRCHSGRCYPCTQVKEVSCRCGAARTLVPCGLEKTTQPPKCKQKCQGETNCHHAKRVPHHCHFGECPPCQQTCLKAMDCGHECPVPCHDNVPVKVKNPIKPATPWEVVADVMEIKKLDCPLCEFPVPVTCLGGHETSDWPCHLAKPSSCGRECGRRLACTNHVCTRSCHRVKNATSETAAGTNCRKCESGCGKERRCVHPCLKPCHPGDCDPCSQMIRIRCHCEITQLYVKCGEWIEAEEIGKREMGCCQDQCPKLLKCGHRCSKICHQGDCLPRSECRKKVKVYCPCKCIKQEMICSKVPEQFKLSCGSGCKSTDKKVKKDEEEKLKEEKERLLLEEGQKFEQQMEFGKRGKRNRQRRNRFEEGAEEEGITFFKRHRHRIMLTVLVALPLLIAYYLCQ